MNREPRMILLDEEARAKLLKGAKIVNDLVKQAYGPTSGNVLIEKNYGPCVLSHDGISIVREVYLKDPVENAGARLLVEASKSTLDKVGDGTTATVILAYHIIEKSLKRIASGYNAMELKQGILKASEAAVSEIKKLSEDVKDKLGEVATISCGDDNLGKLIADTIEKIGDNGNVTVEESREASGVECEIVEGFYFKKGFANAFMVTNPDRMTSELKKPYILVTEKKLTKISDIMEVLKAINDGGKRPGEGLLVIGDVSGEALNMLIANKINKAVISVSVAPPIVGDQSSMALEDIAIYTGAKFITNSDDMESITVDDLGRAESVFVDSESTTIIKGAGDPKERIESIKNAIKAEKNPFRKERMEDRLARISGKVGVIKVGGSTETEMLETKFRVDDAVCATKAAKEEGIVFGGGITLVHISNLLSKIEGNEGFKATTEAFKEPFKQLIDNSFGSSEFYLRKIEEEPLGMGYNIKKGDDVIDLKQNGVIDATKVIRMVVENGCSIAANFITTNGVIVFEEKEDVKPT